MRQICSRPDCAERAVARVLIEPTECRIVVDRRVELAGAAILCAGHADRVTVPKGWTLDDRREDSPRLFGVGRFNEPARTSRERLRRLPEAIAAAVTQLPLDGADPYDLPPRYEQAAQDLIAHPNANSNAHRDATLRPTDGSHAFTARGNEPRMSVTDRALARANERELNGVGAPIFADVAARGPLLARAFEAARSRVRTSSGLTSLIPQHDDPHTASAGAGA